jgi:hypothetical protein
MADWRQLYAATMVETDAKDLDLLIEQTSRGIESRLDELMRSKTNNDERKEIVIAANALLMLKASPQLWNKQEPS